LTAFLDEAIKNANELKTMISNFDANRPTDENIKAQLAYTNLQRYNEDFRTLVEKINLYSNYIAVEELSTNLVK
jgi:hypothetical protein